MKEIAIIANNDRLFDAEFVAPTVTTLQRLGIAYKLSRKHLVVFFFFFFYKITL